jgi:hypothetical protein
MGQGAEFRDREGIVSLSAHGAMRGSVRDLLPFELFESSGSSDYGYADL